MAYTTRTGEKNPYGGSKPLCAKCKYHHNGPCSPKFHKYNRLAIWPATVGVLQILMLVTIRGALGQLDHWKWIFKNKTKRKPKAKQSQARDGKVQVKSKSKVIHMKKIQLEGLKLPNPKLYYKNQKTRVEIAKRGEVLQRSYKNKGAKTANLPKLHSSRPKQNPGATWACHPIPLPCKTTQHPR
ncbi:hypothetical protein Tco_0450578 [Tanacetum coccineum]